VPGFRPSRMAQMWSSSATICCHTPPSCISTVVVTTIFLSPKFDLEAPKVGRRNPATKQTRPGSESWKHSRRNRAHDNTLYFPRSKIKQIKKMSSQVQQRPSVNGVMPRKPAAPRTAPTKRPAAKQTPNGTAPRSYPKAAPVPNKAYSVAGGENASGNSASAYSIMASRIANRVAEMAESITFVEK